MFMVVFICGIKSTYENTSKQSQNHIEVRNTASIDCELNTSFNRARYVLCKKIRTCRIPLHSSGRLLCMFSLFATLHMYNFKRGSKCYLHAVPFSIFPQK